MSTPAGGPAYFDASGCLSGPGMAVLQHATSGTVPPEVAQHFAGCKRCQDRLLSAAVAMQGLGRAGGDLPRLRNRVRWVAGITIVLLLALLGVLAVMAVMLRQRTG
jgi:hypothetical protein